MEDQEINININKIKDKKLKTNIIRTEGALRQTQKSQKIHNFYQTETEGYLEAEENEQTLKFRQKDLEPLLSQQNTKNIFSLNNIFGPYLLDFTRDGNHMLLCGQRGHCSLIQFQKKQLVTEFHVNERVHDIAFLQNHTLFAVAQKHCLYIYDDKGMEIHKLRTHIEPFKLEYLPYHYLLASASRLGYMKYLDVSTGQIVSEYKPKTKQINCMRQNNQNGIMLVGDTRGRVSFMSPNTADPLVQIQCQKSNILDIACHQYYMATLGSEQSMKIWDIRNSFKPLFEYFTPDQASTLSISQKGLLSVGGKHFVNIWKDWKVEKQKKPYMKQNLDSACSDLKFVDYQDYLAIGHVQGFQSIVVPGAGEANFDTFEVNLFATKRQRQEKEVKSLLEKIPWQSISMRPDQIGTMDKASKDVLDKERAYQEAEQSKRSKKNQKKKMRGKNKSGKREARKERVHDSQTREKLVEMSNNSKMVRKAERIQHKKEASLLENADDFNPEQHLKKKKIHI